MTHVCLELDGQGHTYGLRCSKLWSLISDTWRLVNQGCCSGNELARLVGHWTWPMLARWQTLCVFNAVYRFIFKAEKKVLSIWRSVRKELLTAAALAPTLFVHTSASFFHSAIATDASLDGQGVVAARLPFERQLVAASAAGLCDNRVVTDQQIATTLIANTASWRTIVSSRWRRPLQHITEGEARAIHTGVRWVSSHSQASGKRVLIYSDNTAAVGSLSKGRSSSYWPSSSECGLVAVFPKCG